MASTCTWARASRDVVAWAMAGRRGSRAARASSAPSPTRHARHGRLRRRVPGARTPRRRRTSALRWSPSSTPPGCACRPSARSSPAASLVGAAGTLVASVLHTRSRPPYPQQIVLDAGMTELIRPALYGSVTPSPSSRAPPTTPRRNVTSPMSTAVEGAVCESTDSFGVHELPRLVARRPRGRSHEAGAYCRVVLVPLQRPPTRARSCLAGTAAAPSANALPPPTTGFAPTSRPKQPTRRPPHRAQPERNSA